MNFHGVAAAGIFLRILVISETSKLPVPVLKGKKRCQNLAPVLVIISGNSLVFSRKFITSTGFYRCCAPSASAPVVVKNQSPIIFVHNQMPLKLSNENLDETMTG